MDNELKAYLYAAGAAVALSIVIAILGYPFFKALRAVFGFIYVLFVPGYVVVRCFFNDLDWIEKLGLSAGLSIALVIVAIMISNLLFRIPINTLTNFLVILFVIGITLFVKKYEEQITGKLVMIKKKMHL